MIETLLESNLRLNIAIVAKMHIRALKSLVLYYYKLLHCIGHRKLTYPQISTTEFFSCFRGSAKISFNLRGFTKCKPMVRVFQDHPFDAEIESERWQIVHDIDTPSRATTF